MSRGTHEQWGSQVGFLLAALGSAVGLGNLWRFSYVVGENGGGAFIVVYLLMVVAIGVPLLLSEFALGRSTRSESLSAIRSAAGAGPWRWLGLIGLLVACVVLAYYAVIAGWVFKYLAVYLSGAAPAFAAGGHEAAFEAYIARPLEPVAWQALGLAVTAAVIARGVQQGIEKASLLLMPALALLLLGLALYSATLPGLPRGLAFLFAPDWSALASPAVWVAAVGQAFFSIGIAMGVMITYGSYIEATVSLPRAALIVGLGDTLFALTAGLVIFPAVFSFGADPAQGPGLAFVVLPGIFARMPGGAAVGALFFLLLSIAALTSMLSLLEVPVAWTMQRLGLGRPAASALVGVLLFLLGLPASLGYGVWSHLSGPGGRSLLDAMDFLAVDILLPLNGLLLALFFGWVWPAPRALEASGLGRGALGRLWRFGLRWVLPAVLLAVFAFNLRG